MKGDGKPKVAALETLLSWAPSAKEAGEAWDAFEKAQTEAGSGD
jgi:hypothetical protein